MRTLLGTSVYSKHAQNIALGLAEAGWLGRYETGAVDVWRSAPARRLRNLVGTAAPAVDRTLRRRAISEVPHAFVHSNLAWEGTRAILEQLPVSPRVTDWLWEHGEHALARRCAAMMRAGRFDLYVGVEHGALEALQACRGVGRPGVVMFLSPHHAFRERWLAPEREAFPELVSLAQRTLVEMGAERDARRDEEMSTAHLVRANSGLTARSLVEAGVAPGRIVTVPIGCPPALDAPGAPEAGPIRVLYAGPLSVRKGFHYLLAAWRRLRPAGAELHAYGRSVLPGRVLADLPSGVVLHGSVPRAELMEAYEQAHLLAFPTLCDGFGMVASEALSRGVPVLTTQNAGAADLIEDGVNGYVVAPADADALADRLDACLQDPSALLDMRPAALDTARSWTWAHFREAFVGRLAGRLAEVGFPEAEPAVDRPL